MTDGKVDFDVIARDKASSTLTKVGKETDRLSARHTAFAAAGGAAFGSMIGSVVGFAKSSITAYAQSEGAQTRLDDAFKRFPKLADTNAEAIRKVADAIQSKTGADHNQIDSGAAVLAQFGLTGSQVQSVLPLLVDYATKTGQDIPTAAATMGKALLGHGRALQAIGIQFKTTGNSTKDFTNLTGLLRQKVGGFADEEGKTAEGQAKRLSASFTDMKEKIGKALLPVLTSFGAFLNAHIIPLLTKVVTFIQRNAAAIKPLVAIVLTIIAAWKVYAVTQALVNAVMDANPIGLIVIALAGLVVGIVMAYKHSETFRTIVQAVFRDVKKAASVVVDFFTGPFLKAIGLIVRVYVTGFKFLLDVWLGVVGGIIDGAAKALGWVPGLGPKLRTAAKAFDGFKDAVNGTLQGVINSSETWGQSFAQGFTTGITKGTGAAAFAAYNMGKLSEQGLQRAIRASSPSKAAHEQGLNFGHGYAGGIDASAYRSVHAVRRMANGSLAALGTAGSLPVPSGGGLIGELRAIRAEMERNTSAVRRVAPDMATVQRTGHSQSLARPAR